MCSDVHMEHFPGSRNLIIGRSTPPQTVAYMRSSYIRRWSTNSWPCVQGALARACLQAGIHPGFFAPTQERSCSFAPTQGMSCPFLCFCVLVLTFVTNQRSRSERYCDDEKNDNDDDIVTTKKMMKSTGRENGGKPSMYYYYYYCYYN